MKIYVKRVGNDTYITYLERLPATHYELLTFGHYANELGKNNKYSSYYIGNSKNEICSCCKQPISSYTEFDMENNAGSETAITVIRRLG